jgi:predicted cupin superfamily sugar epimerase
VTASEAKDSKPSALVGCTVAPGFVFEDFELAEREPLVTSYPQHRALIDRLTRA